MPQLFAGFRINRKQMVVRGGQIHYAVIDDRRALDRFGEIDLKSPGELQILDRVRVDPIGEVVACLRIVAVRDEKISAVLRGGVQALLAQRAGLRHGRSVVGETRHTNPERHQTHSYRTTQLDSVRKYQVTAPR